MQRAPAALFFIFFITFSSLCAAEEEDERRSHNLRPNVIILLADDLGYGDLGYNGHPTVQTPNLDRLAHRGVRLNELYTAHPLCTPSRASLLTGRLAVRMGLAGQFNRVPTNATSGVIPCNAQFGLPHNELTLAEYLQQDGYATHYIGKWHLGHLPEYLPQAHGFDDFFGLPYSVDMGYFHSPSECALLLAGCPPIPLMHNTEIVQQPLNRDTLSEQLTQKAEHIISQSKRSESESESEFENERARHIKPFFLQFAFPQVHVDCSYTPFVSNRSTTSTTPPYLASVQELDGIVGRIVGALERAGQLDNTLIIFTADNGPLTLPQYPLIEQLYPQTTQRGSVGPFTGTYATRFTDVTAPKYGTTDVGKCSTWEAGLRVPGIVSYPHHFQEGSVYRGTITLMDFLPSILGMLNISLDPTNPLDGKNMFPLIRSQETDEQRTLFLYRGGGLYAARQGPYKFHFAIQGGCTSKDGMGVLQSVPIGFNLISDFEEAYPLLPVPTAVLAGVEAAVTAHLDTLNAPPSLLTAINQTTIVCCNPALNCFCA